MPTDFLRLSRRACVVFSRCLLLLGACPGVPVDAINGNSHRGTLVVGSASSSASVDLRNAPSIAASESSIRLCKGQSCEPCDLSPSGQTWIRQSGSTAFTTSKIVSCSGDFASRKPPCSPRWPTTTPPRCSDWRTLERYGPGTLVPLAIFALVCAVIGSAAKKTTARRAYSTVCESIGNEKRAAENKSGP